MKRVVLGGFWLEITYEGKGEGDSFNDPKMDAVFEANLILPDGFIMKLTGTCADDIMEHIWAYEGYIYRADSYEDVPS